MKRVFWLLLNIGISVFFIWLAVRGIDFDELAKSFWGVSIGFVLFSVALNLFSCWLRALRWQYLLLPIKRIRTSRVFSALMIGFMVNNVLPFRLGEFVRGYALKQSDNISFSASMGTVVIERIIDVLTLLMIFGFILLLFPFPEWVKNGSILVAAIVAVSIFILFMLVKRTDWTLKLVHRVVSFFSVKLAYKIDKIVKSFIEGVSFLHSAKSYVIITVLSVVTWVTYIYVMYAMFYAVHFDLLYQLDMLGATVVMVFTSFAIMIPAAPGYVGTFHEIAKQSLMLLNVDKEHALGFAIIFHASHYISVTGIGFFYFFKNRLKLKDALHSADVAEQPIN
ncbi:flippase-like domain-containing protein [bacterium]|nr:flippase-like domain-containing protein [bacterium]